MVILVMLSLPSEVTQLRVHSWRTEITQIQIHLEPGDTIRLKVHTTPGVIPLLELHSMPGDTILLKVHSTLGDIPLPKVHSMSCGMQQLLNVNLIPGYTTQLRVHWQSGKVIQIKVFPLSRVLLWSTRVSVGTLVGGPLVARVKENGPQSQDVFECGRVIEPIARNDNNILKSFGYSSFSQTLCVGDLSILANNVFLLPWLSS